MTVILDRRETEEISSTFTLAFCLGALFKLRLREVESKQTAAGWRKLRSGGQIWQELVQQGIKEAAQRKGSRNMHRGSLESLAEC